MTCLELAERALAAARAGEGGALATVHSHGFPDAYVARVTHS